MGSEIKTPTLQLRVSNIFNLDNSNLYSSGAWAFKNSSGVTTWAVSDGGLASIGISGTTTYGIAHVVNGTLSGGGTGVGDAQQRFSFGTNLYYSASGSVFKARVNPTNNTLGGAGIECYARTADTSAAIVFLANKTTDTPTTDATLIGLVTHAGAWTFGPGSFAGTHTFNGRVYGQLPAGDNTTYHQFLTSGATVGTEVLRLTRAGLNLTANTTFLTCDWYDHTANGIIGTNGSSAFTISTASDVRLKRDIVSASYGLHTIMALRPVEFKWISQENSPVVKGFIAQEVKEILPESVSVAKSGDLEDAHSLETSTMIPVLVKAIQELSAQLEDAKTRLSLLENK